ncbi:hypothetical protein L226DRAFT_570258 [Lentinus tigrinus ALCF2SS1-7]|uniref:uncharacterized protein n=1 Tax=Lentinus tigrinus ALCF2SS1-7 TaxID=1328758 RepID=UPI001165EDA6|nr:hypothetical protein L226DRAFT_570258 [Lentinus tigrinus ALCF2SS1-7]
MRERLLNILYLVIQANVASSIILHPQALASKAAVLPAGKTTDDIEASRVETPFPSLAVASS